MPFSFGYDDLGICVEQGTARVPSDGQYHVLVDGNVVESYGNAKRALASLQRLRAQRQAGGRHVEAVDPKAKALAAEVTARFLSERRVAHHDRARRKGGKGR